MSDPGDPLIALRACADRACIVLDFDGTLAPIVDDPGDARPMPAAIARMRELAGAYAVVAVLSGRPGAFLAERLAPSLAGAPVRLIGLYGAEEVDGRRITHSAATPEGWSAFVEEATAHAEASAPDGARTERKGPLLTLHWRAVPSAATWARSFAGARAASWPGAVAAEGRCSVELRPPGFPDKGSTLLAIGDGLAGTCYVGDDAGDLDAFRAVRTLAQAAPGRVGVCVAVSSLEAPQELVQLADIVLDGTGAVPGLLASLLP